MASGEVYVTAREKESAAPRAELVRPVRQLAAAMLLLLGLVLLSAVGIGLVKLRVDRRLDATVFNDAIALANASLKGGSIDQAEETLMAVGRARPRLQTRLMWAFVDHLAVMPEYRARAETGSSSMDSGAEPGDSAALLRAELALRSDDPKQPLAALSNTPEGKTGIYAAAYRRAAAIACHDFKSLADAANGSGHSWRNALPRTSLLWALPQARLARRQECMAEGNSPEAGYLRAVAAFHEGRLDAAEEALSACWRDGIQSADTAYMLGALHEAREKPEEARDWYARAVAAGDGHLDASAALLRLAGKSG